MGGGITGQQRGGLFLRARLPQAVQQPGHSVRVVEGNAGGGALGQRGDLLMRARPLRAAQQPGHGVRIVESDVGDGPAHRADVSAEVVRRVGEVRNRLEVAVGGGVFVELGGV